MLRHYCWRQDSFMSSNSEKSNWFRALNRDKLLCFLYCERQGALGIHGGGGRDGDWGLGGNNSKASWDSDSGIGSSPFAFIFTLGSLLPSWRATAHFAYLVVPWITSQELGNLGCPWKTLEIFAFIYRNISKLEGDIMWLQSYFYASSHL